MRAIDADNLKDKTKQFTDCDGFNLVWQIIDNAPTIEITDYDTGYQDGLEDGLNDIRPQGEWLVVGHDDTTYWYRCSICEYTEHDNFTKHHHFCPNCGADMRGGKNETN